MFLKFFPKLKKLMGKCQKKLKKNWIPMLYILLHFMCYFSLGRVIQFSQFSHSVVSNSLQPHGLQHTRTPCPSPTPGVYSNSCPWSQWCHPTISSSVIPFSFYLQSFPASGSFSMSQFFKSGGQSNPEKLTFTLNEYSHIIKLINYWVLKRLFVFFY